MSQKTCVKCHEVRKNEQFRLVRNGSGELYRSNQCVCCDREYQREWSRAKYRAVPETIQAYSEAKNYKCKSKNGRYQTWSSEDGDWEGWLTISEIAGLPWVKIGESAVRRRLMNGEDLLQELATGKNSPELGYPNPEGTGELTKLLRFKAPDYRPEPTYGVYR